MNKNKQQSGFSHVLILVIIVVIAAIGFVGYKVVTGGERKSDDHAATYVHPDSSGPVNSAQNTQNTQVAAVKDSWEYDGTDWKATGKAPACANPILKRSPVNMSTVTAILYPGQVRGQYKAHGGFHFRNNTTNDVQVVMPIDGKITGATRYYQTGDNGVDELQYLVTFLNDCGVSIKFDHLLTLSPEMQKVMDSRPPAKLNDTGGLPIKGGQLFKEGAVIATAVGQKSNLSVGMDFGVYDFRQRNAASKDPNYAKNHSNTSYEDLYATCWLNDLPPADATLAKSLPGGDGKMGKTSDYCK